MQTMSKVKNEDSVSARGQRSVSLGITTDEGRQHLKGFDFNNRAPLKSVLFSPFALENNNGEVTFTDLLPAEQLQFPKGSTHFSLQSAVLLINFETQFSKISQSAVVNYLSTWLSRLPFWHPKNFQPDQDRLSSCYLFHFIRKSMAFSIHWKTRIITSWLFWILFKNIHRFRCIAFLTCSAYRAGYFVFKASSDIDFFIEV